MYNKVPFTNHANHPVYSPDGKLVPPGETRLVTQLGVAAAPAPPTEPDALLELLDNKVQDIVPHLAHMDGAALARLLQAEQDGKTRKSLIEAIELRIMEVQDAAKLDGAAPPANPAAIDGEAPIPPAADGSVEAAGDGA